jgi:hypothetical protein
MELQVSQQLGAEVIQIGHLSVDSILTGCSEDCHYLIAVPHTGAVLSDRDLQLFADDEPLQREGTYWRWNPGFYAGEVAFELEQNGRTQKGHNKIIRYRADVSPAPHKTGREQYSCERLFDDNFH